MQDMYTYMGVPRRRVTRVLPVYSRNNRRVNPDIILEIRN
jgi:hypothetical protein